MAADVSVFIDRQQVARGAKEKYAATATTQLAYSTSSVQVNSPVSTSGGSSHGGEGGDIGHELFFGCKKISVCRTHVTKKGNIYRRLHRGVLGVVSRRTHGQLASQIGMDLVRGSSRLRRTSR